MAGLRFHNLTLGYERHPAVHHLDGAVESGAMILDGDHQRPWHDGEQRESRIVFIGRNLPEDKIRGGFESCIA